MNVIEICQKLIQVKSYSGEEGQVVKVIEGIMDQLKFDEIKTDKYGNIYGIYIGNKPGPSQVYDAHIDTVVVPDQSKWKHKPFAGEIEDGKLYGRGTTDMKGALAAMLVGASKFVEETKGDFAGRICVVGVVHEECFEGVAAREISKNLKPDYVIIGEASSLNLKHGQRGRAEVVIETFGKPAHSANPEKGINAVYLMTQAVNEISRIEPIEDVKLGKGILALTDIISSPYPGASVIPDYCRTTWDRRLIVGETKESVLKSIKNILKDLEKTIPNFKGKVSLANEEVLCYTGKTIGDERFFPGWFYDVSHSFVSKTYENLLKAGFDSILTHYDFCTNGSHYAGEAGIKTIGFGPSKETLAHTIDEYVELEQLEKAVDGYGIIMKTLENLR